MEQELTLEIAKKVLEVVDKGLSNGLGKPIPDEMCVEAAVCYAYGLPHNDNPPCVSRAVRVLKIQLNDSEWSSTKARGIGMRRLAIAQLGSADVIDNKEFAKRVADYTIRTTVPQALRAAALIQKDTHHKGALLDAALRCEKEGTEEASEAASAASAASWAASDKQLSDFAEGVVQILIELKSPGCEFLYLTE